MMDYIAGLVQRGILNPDAAQNLVQNVADLKNQRPWETGGGAAAEGVYTPRGYGEPTASDVPSEYGEPSKGGNVAGRKNMQGQLGKFSLPDLWDDFQSGLNDRQIADKYGVTRPAITQRRKAWGIEPKPRGRPWPPKESNQE